MVPYFNHRCDYGWCWILAHNLNRNGSSWRPLAKLSVNGTKHAEIWLVCIVSGGNIDAARLAAILRGETPD